MSKKTVLYDPDYLVALAMGIGALVKPIDHTSDLVSNKKMVYTSNVIRVEESGVFETQNTIYVPNRICKTCRHEFRFHTIDAPMDYMGCTECDCNEFKADIDPKGGANHDNSTANWWGWNPHG